MRVPLLASLGLSLLVTAPAGARLLRPSTGITLGVTGGTLGIGPEASFKLNPLVAIRGSATFLNFGHGDDLGSYDYRGRVRLRNYGTTVDSHPLLNGLRLSRGARVTDDNRIRFTGRPRDTETFGSVTLTPDRQGTLGGEIVIKSVAPIVTLGYASTNILGFTFGVDAGAMFHREPRVEKLVATGRLADDRLVQARRLEQEQRLCDEIDGYKPYPVVQLGAGFRF